MSSKKEYTIEDVKQEAAKEQVKQEYLEQKQLIVFKLGQEEYGLSIEQIKEVVLTPRIAKMPQTPDYIRGVANIRGNIIAIMDLEQKFGLNSSTEQIKNDAFNYTLVMESEEFNVGILVKEVPNTLTITTADIDDASDFVQYTSLNINSLLGVVKSGERMIILIDLLKLIETEDL